MTADELAAVVGRAAIRELDSAWDRIRHCLAQLNDEQIWDRSAPGLNSIGNLILHCCGNLRQWIVCGLTGAPDTRNRPAEFAEQGPIPRGELLDRMQHVEDDSKRVLAGLTAEQIASVRRVQGFELTGAEVIFDTVPHFRGHAQEIVHMTRLRLGPAYRFAWTPQTGEEGAAL
jgi:hypothetical protein